MLLALHRTRSLRGHHACRPVAAVRPLRRCVVVRLPVEGRLMRSDRQLDLYRHSPDARAEAYRAAAETARRNPFETPEAAEQRARFYEAEAARLQGRLS